LTGSGNQYDTSSHHHTGRDATLGAGAVGLGEHEHHKHQHQHENLIDNTRTGAGNQYDDTSSGLTGTGNTSGLTSSGVGETGHSLHHAEGNVGDERNRLHKEPPTSHPAAQGGVAGAGNVSGNY